MMRKMIENDEEVYEEDDVREVPADLSERLELETEKEVAPEWFDCSSQEALKSTRSTAQEESSSASQEIQNRKESLQKIDLMRKSLTRLCCRRKVARRTVEKSTASEKKKKKTASLLCQT